MEGDIAQPLTRDFTATTFVVRDGRTLLIYHKQIRDWLPPGGHLHPNELPCDAAVREVREETGLEVEIASPRSRLGHVEVLRRPECILLEQLEDGHQHIDLIYFGRVVGGRLRIAEDEAEDYRWYTAESLGSPDIAEDVRYLGRRAIEEVERRFCGAGDRTT